MEISSSDFDLETWERNDVVDRADDGLGTWDCEGSVDEIMLHVDDDESRYKSWYGFTVDGHCYICIGGTHGLDLSAEQRLLGN